MLEMMYSEVSLQKQMADGCRFIIVYNEAQPVGFASYQEIESSVFKLHKIYVLTSQQGKGIGKELVFIQPQIALDNVIVVCVDGHLLLLLLQLFEYLINTSGCGHIILPPWNNVD